MEEAHDDEVAVTIADAVREPNLAALELPLAVKPTEKGIDGALALIGGIEELSKVTADEVRGRATNDDGLSCACLPQTGSCCGCCWVGFGPGPTFSLVTGRKASVHDEDLSRQDCCVPG